MCQSLVAEQGEWEETRLVKVNLEQRKHQKLHVCYMEAFSGTKPNPIAMKSVDNTNVKDFLHFLPPQRFFIVYF